MDKNVKIDQVMKFKENDDESIEKAVYQFGPVLVGVQMMPSLSNYKLVSKSLSMFLIFKEKFKILTFTLLLT